MSVRTENSIRVADALARSDQPFSKAVLPRRGWCGRPVPNAHGSQSACEDGAIDRIAITDHATRSTVPRKSLPDLACDLPRRRVGCDVDPDEISAINPYNHEAIQQFEADGRDHEQIHGGNLRSAVAQKGLPSRRGGRLSAAISGCREARARHYLLDRLQCPSVSNRPIKAE
jgi:hypothetical protein